MQLKSPPTAASSLILSWSKWSSSAPASYILIFLHLLLLLFLLLLHDRHEFRAVKTISFHFKKMAARIKDFEILLRLIHLLLLNIISIRLLSPKTDVEVVGPSLSLSPVLSAILFNYMYVCTRMSLLACVV